MGRLTRAELFALLDERVRDPKIGAEQDREIWDTCSAERAILVLDLSGFTRLTHQRGILHFLTIFRRACGLSAAAVAAASGAVVKIEADNVIATFDDAKSAVAAARDIQARAAAGNVGRPEDEHVRVCIAVGFGRFLALADDVYGDEVNVTFKLGEDVARAGEILLTDGAHARLVEAGEHVDAAPETITTGSVEVRYWNLVV